MKWGQMKSLSLCVYGPVHKSEPVDFEGRIFLVQSLESEACLENAELFIFSLIIKGIVH